MSNRKNKYDVELTVAERGLGLYDSTSGGDSTTADLRIRPGGGAEESLGGPSIRSPLVLTRVVEPGRDTVELFEFLEACQGIRNLCSVVRRRLDDEGNPVGRTESWEGTLLGVTNPESDSNSSDLSMYSLEVSPAPLPARNKRRR